MNDLFGGVFSPETRSPLHPDMNETSDERIRKLGPCSLITSSFTPFEEAMNKRNENWDVFFWGRHVVYISL